MALRLAASTGSPPPTAGTQSQVQMSTPERVVPHSLPLTKRLGLAGLQARTRLLCCPLNTLTRHLDLALCSTHRHADATLIIIDIHRHSSFMKKTEGHSQSFRRVRRSALAAPSLVEWFRVSLCHTPLSRESLSASTCGLVAWGRCCRSRNGGRDQVLENLLRWVGRGHVEDWQGCK
jgi:hypothetical protein